MYRYRFKQPDGDSIMYVCPVCRYVKAWDDTWDEVKKAEVKAEVQAEVDQHHNEHFIT